MNARVKNQNSMRVTTNTDTDTRYKYGAPQPKEKDYLFETSGVVDLRSSGKHWKMQNISQLFWLVYL